MTTSFNYSVFNDDRIPYTELSLSRDFDVTPSPDTCNIGNHPIAFFIDDDVGEESVQIEDSELVGELLGALVPPPGIDNDDADMNPIALIEDDVGQDAEMLHLGLVNELLIALDLRGSEQR